MQAEMRNVFRDVAELVTKSGAAEFRRQTVNIPADLRNALYMVQKEFWTLGYAFGHVE